jgi:hypothetical protein
VFFIRGILIFSVFSSNNIDVYLCTLETKVMFVLVFPRKNIDVSLFFSGKNIDVCLSL